MVILFRMNENNRLIHDEFAPSNKRMAKNTILLYTRMLVIMCVSLLTTRVVLSTLGVTDYGIYNTIGGIVALFAFINNSVLTATQRYLNFYFGKGRVDEAGQYFSASVVIFVFIGLIIIALSEIAGLWFIEHKMSFPEDRLEATRWTLHFTSAITFINIIRAPYHACIIAHEKMSFYAYISLVEAGLKLIIVYVLTRSSVDKLVLYNVLLFAISLCIMVVFKYYCNRNYQESRIVAVANKEKYKEVLSFSSYSLLGNAANVCSLQGSALLLNVFSGVITNAAIGVANQVCNGLYSLISSFQVAFNPQLTKQFARNEIEGLKINVCRVSKISFYLLLILALPFFFYCHELLDLWLEEVPMYAESFCVLIIGYLLVDTVAAPLWITVQATGKIKIYQVITSLIILINLPVDYLLLKNGYGPQNIFVVRLVINIAVFLFRLFYVLNLLRAPIKYYILSTFKPILLSSVFPVIVGVFLPRCIVSLLVVEVIALTSIIVFGFSRAEINSIVSLIKKRISI